MKKLVIMLAMLAIAASAQANLLTNGDFTNGFDGWWTYDGNYPGAQSVLIESPSSADGSNYAALASAATIDKADWAAMLGQSAPIDPNLTYDLNFDYAVVAEAGWHTLGVLIEYSDAATTPLAWEWITMYDGMNINQDWTNHNIQTTTPAGTAYLNVQFHSGNWGTVQIDNVDVMPSGLLVLDHTPVDGDTNVQLIDNILSWSEPALAPGATYNVYFSTDPNLPTALEIDYPSTSLAVTLDYDKTYYWRLDTNYAGDTHENHMWSFTATGKVGNPSPADQSAGAASEAELSWGIRTFYNSYDVYFGSSPETLAFVGNLSDPNIPNAGSLTLPALTEFTTYYWKVDAYDLDNVLLPGDVWSFTTGGLLAHWKFDNDFTDSGTFGRHGTYYGNPTFASGLENQSVDLDGNDYIEVPPLDRPDIMTIMAWVKTSAGGDKDIIGWMGSVNSMQLFINTGGYLSYVEFDGANWLTTGSTAPIADGTWHHVAVTRDGPAIELFVDGVSVATGGAHGALSGTASYMTIGCVGGFANFYTGEIDDLQLHSGVLSDADIKAEHDAYAAAINPIPANFAVDVNPFELTLGWTSDTGTTYDVYLSNDPNYQPLVANGISTNSHPVGSALDVGSNYYWSVAVDGAPGPVWEFTTQPQSPVSGHLGILPWGDPVLAWPVHPTAASYNLYLGADGSALSLVGNTAIPDSSSLTIPAMAEVTQYNWQVEAIDGLSSVIWTSSVWNFITAGGLGDPIAHWEFEGDPNDSSGNDYDGSPTGVGTPTYVDGIFGQAIQLLGDEVIVVSHFDRPEYMTITAWVNLYTEATVDILSWSGPGTGGGDNSQLFTAGGQLLYGEWNGSTFNFAVSDAGTVPNFQWHHVAIVRAGTEKGRIFIDGQFVQVTNEGLDPFVPGMTDVLNIGCYNNGELSNYAGLLDDIKVYPTALSDMHVNYAYSLRCDSNDDGDIDLGDFAEVASNWLSASPAWGDFNGNGNVDIDDFIIFGEAWLADYK